MPRSDSRRDYRHFPREYTDLLVAFERDGRAALTFTTRREASTARRLLYQFKMLAVSSADADPDDTQARWLVDVFNTVTLRLEPAGAGEAGGGAIGGHDGGVINGASPSYTVSQADRGPTTLILDSNPVVRAMRAARAAVPVQGGTVSLEDGAAPVPKAHEPTNEPLFEHKSDAAALANAYRPNAPMLGCRSPAACRSVIHGAPAFCECGDASRQGGTADE